MQMQSNMMGYSNQQFQQRPMQQPGYSNQGYPNQMNPQANQGFPGMANQPRQYPNQYQNPAQYAPQFGNQQQNQGFPQQAVPPQQAPPQQNTNFDGSMGDTQMGTMMTQPMTINQQNQNMQPQVNPQSHIIPPNAQQVMAPQNMNQSGPSTPGQPMTPGAPSNLTNVGPSTPGQPMTPVAQIQPTPSPPPTRPRNIFDELLESYEDVFARLIAKDEMAGVHDKDEVAVGVEYSVNKFISKAQVVELYFNQMIAKVKKTGNLFPNCEIISKSNRREVRRMC